MSKILFMLNLFEAIVELFLFITVLQLYYHSLIPYNFMFFLFVFCLAFFMVFEAFLPKKLENHPLFETRTYTTITSRILAVLAIIIIWLYWDSAKIVMSAFLKTYTGLEF